MKRIIVNEEIASMMYELYLLLHAGTGMGDSLAILAEQEEYKAFLDGISECADRGASLSQCFRDSGKFPSYVCGLIEIGENTGRIEEALLALFRAYDRREKLNNSIRNALLYPAIMLILAIIVIGIMLVKVLPVFNDVYASLGAELTGAAGGLLTIGQWLDKAMPVLWILLICALVLCAVFAAFNPVRERVLRLLRNAFGDSGILRKINTARIVQALAMGLSSGLQLENALDLAGKLMEDIPAAKKRCQDCRKMLDEGNSLSSAMRASGILSEKLCRIPELGQRSGSLDAAMERVSEKLFDECESSIPDWKQLGIPEQVMDLADITSGLVLVTGTAGSGKSTTQACIIDRINRTSEKHIITMENPIEFLHRNQKSIVSQREIAIDTNNYLSALRACLRQAPDVILLGEMRDYETIRTAMTAAETGHLVIATLHTKGAVNTIDRIVDSFPGEQQGQIRVQLSMVLRTVVSQQLLTDVNGNLVPAFEIMNMNSAIRSLIRDNKDHQIDNVISTGGNEDMISMDQFILSLYHRGKITKETALDYADNYEQMNRRL